MTTNDDAAPDYTPTTEVHGQGSITLTYYPSSQRVAVEQRGTNAAMDAYDLLSFADRAGLLDHVRADERARIAARRDEVVGALAVHRPVECSHSRAGRVTERWWLCETCGWESERREQVIFRADAEAHQADAVLAALTDTTQEETR